MYNLRNRSFLKEIDFSRDELLHLLALAQALKTAKYAGNEAPRLTGKEIALIFEKSSTRTRCAFEVAAFDQGAHVTYLDPTGSQMGHKESIADTARVLGRMFDAIEYRGSGQENVEELARHAGVPGLQRAHQRVAPDADAGRLPDHARAHAQALRRASPTPSSATAATTWAARCSMMGAIMGSDVRIITPAELRPPPT